MGVFDKLNTKDNREKKSNEQVSNDKYIVQMIEAEVIAVGCEVTGEEPEPMPEPKQNKKKKKQEIVPERFSYRYKFKDPTNENRYLKAYDELVTVEIGEQIYDVGETLQVLYSNQPSKENNTDFTVTRKIIFPEIANKKRKRIKLFKRLYTLFLIAFVALCFCYSISNTSTTESTPEDTEITQIGDSTEKNETETENTENVDDTNNTETE